MQGWKMREKQTRDLIPDFNKCHIYSYYSYANIPITYKNFG